MRKSSSIARLLSRYYWDSFPLCSTGIIAYCLQITGLRSH